jgi:tetratricopeptide (TPR) repeat protein
MKTAILIILLGAFGCATKNVESPTPTSAPKKEFSLKEIPSDSAIEVPKSMAVVKPPESSKFAKSAQEEFKKGHFDISEANMNNAIKEQPNKSEFYHNLGLIHLAKGEQREAIQAFRKGLQLNPQDAAIGAQLGAIFTKEKDYIKAEIALEIPVQKGSEDPNILNNYAIALAANKKADEAEKIYEKILKANPSSRDIMLNYSILLIDQKQKYKQGLDLLNRLKFVGVQPEARNIINVLENRAKAGLK